VWKRCTARAKHITPLLERRGVTRGELERLAKRHHLGIRQLQRARAAFEKDPLVTTLVRTKGGRPTGLNLLDPKIDALIKHAIKKYYAVRERPTKEHFVLRVQSLARRVKLKPPSRNAVLKRLSREEGNRLDAARLGSKAAKQRWEPRPGKLAVSRPLELIQIDSIRQLFKPS
jgi:putative transposase